MVSSLLSTDVIRGKTMNVRARFSSMNNTESRTFYVLFDTGAAVTSLCKSLLESKGYTKYSKSKIPRQTANGIVYFEQAIVHNFQVDGFEIFETWHVDVISHEFKGFKGILGMDFIGTVETWISAADKKMYVHGGKEKIKELINR